MKAYLERLLFLYGNQKESMEALPHYAFDNTSYLKLIGKIELAENALNMIMSGEINYL